MDRRPGKDAVSAHLRRPGPPPDPSHGAFDATRPLGVYVHFPFCSVRCPYCDFAVDTSTPIPHDRYAAAVIAELGARAAWFRGPGGQVSALRSIYFGGGTPGLWDPGAVHQVIAAVRDAFSAARDLEVTIEANPGEVSAAHLAALRAAGVNRLSLGVQAFQDPLLAAIGRNHHAAAAPAAVAAARAAGFERLSCDLMFGLPGQTMDDWRRSVDALVALAPEHVSAYALTVERGTRFGALDRAGRLDRPDDDLVAAMFGWGREALAAAGYLPYEVSSYGRPGHRAVHNGLYWTGGAYLGLGASAASFRPLADGAGWRFTNARATATWLAAPPDRPAHVEHRPRPALENEALWLGLRTVEGIDRAAHAARHGADPLAAPGRADAAGRCVAAGWLEVTDAAVRLTPAGFLYADEVAARLWA